MESNARDAKPTGAPHVAPVRARVYYVPREDATPEGELAALVACYKYVLERHDGRKNCSKTQSGGQEAQKPSSQELEPGVPVGERDE